VSAPAWSSRREFARELEHPDEELNLARAALLVAREEYPQLPIDRYLMRLDVLAEETRDRLGSESAPPHRPPRLPVPAQPPTSPATA
jgi:hypothetical protein